MTAEHILQELLMKKEIDEIRHYFLDKMKQNHFNSKKLKKVCTALIYNKQSLNSVLSWVCFNFYSSIVFPIDIPSSAIRLKICAITKGIKKP